MAGLAKGAIVTNKVPYSDYLDFGQNKGIFTPGSTGLEIKDVNGTTVKVLDLPMIDFAVQNIDGRYATLTDVNQISSVKHNGGYQSVRFGNSDFNYRLVTRNNFNPYTFKDKHYSADYHTPRLSKLVTEVAPIGYLEGTQENMEKVFNSDEYGNFLYRSGTGIQKVVDTKDGNKHQFLAEGYYYAVGGISNKVGGANYNQGRNFYFIKTLGSTNEMTSPGEGINSPLPFVAQPGDSGSGLFAYHKASKKWVLIGVAHTYGLEKGYYSGYNGGDTGYQSIPAKFNFTKKDFNEIPLEISENTDFYRLPYEESDKFNYGKYCITTSRNNAGLECSFNDTWLGKTKDRVKPIYKHQTQDDADNNTGNEFVFTSKKPEETLELRIKSDINQGAGYLQFKNGKWNVVSTTAENAKANTSFTYEGAGIIVDQGAEVSWDLTGKANDGLHRIGAGTLTINNRGKNPGYFRVGDGVTYLNTQEQAFNQIVLTSGRAKVVQNTSNAVSGNELYWGFRGGIFDANGYSHNIDRNDIGIKSANDLGGIYTNSNQEKRSTLIFAPGGEYSRESKESVLDSSKNICSGNKSKYVGQLAYCEGNNTFKINNTGITVADNKRYFFTLRTGQSQVGNLDNKGVRINNNFIELSAGNYETAKEEGKIILQKYYHRAFHGQVTDNVDLKLQYAAIPTNLSDFSKTLIDTVGLSGRFAFDGKVDIKGKVEVENANLIFQGKPVRHGVVTAISQTNLEKAYGTDKINGQLNAPRTPTHKDQTDWEERYFGANSLSIKNGQLEVGRNAVAALTGNSSISQGVLHVGVGKAVFDSRDELSRYNSTFTFEDIVKPTGKERAVLYADKLNLTHSDLNVSNALFFGEVSNDQNSHINVTDQSTFIFNPKSSAVASRGRSALTQEPTLHNFTLENSDLSFFLNADKNFYQVKAGDFSHLGDAFQHLPNIEHFKTGELPTLTLDNPNLTNSTVSVLVRGSDQKASTVKLTGNVQGGNNTLKVVEIDHNYPQVYSIPLAEAPKTVAESYFTIGEIVKGFTVYEPNSKVVEEGDKKVWTLYREKSAEDVKAEEAARLIAEAEEARKKAAEEEARRKAEKEEADRQAALAEAKRQEELKRQAEEEERRQAALKRQEEEKQQIADEKQRQAEEEALRKQEAKLQDRVVRRQRRSLFNSQPEEALETDDIDIDDGDTTELSEDQFLADFFTAGNNNTVIDRAVSAMYSPIFTATSLVPNLVNSPLLQDLFTENSAIKAEVSSSARQIDNSVGNFGTNPYVRQDGFSTLVSFDNYNAKHKAYDLGSSTAMLSLGTNYKSQGSNYQVLLHYGKSNSKDNKRNQNLSSSENLGFTLGYQTFLTDNLAAAISSSYYHNKEKMDLSWLNLSATEKQPIDLFMTSGLLAYRHKLSDSLSVIMSQQLSYLTANSYRFKDKNVELMMSSSSLINSLTGTTFQYMGDGGRLRLALALYLNYSSNPGTITLKDDYKVRKYRVGGTLSVLSSLKAAYHITPNFRVSTTLSVGKGKKVSSNAFNIGVEYRF
ncbi:S6 family peptidase [Mergibacter septicus]|uniref:S6 family peptidase n=1 Tax=Mergibacter septicus TaxID=221402 RepID=UPI0021C4765F|nr:S6 family peptidase [Mergibacter septicus]WMR96802.1 S6 family peptidase [Mergibacter septicus]